ncbi:hypothetical protein CBS101457_006896 [Exobasidium rhododendri]|nr:hypothetical protein CBS101457_006896 [Exobasidium rhododendri]
MTSVSSCSMVASPVQAEEASSSCSRSRNAQAQADLRARRKTYLAELESGNANLTRHNEELEHEREFLLEQISTLTGQVKTLKDSFGLRSAAPDAMDSLLAAVEKEKNKVKRLRGAIKKMAAIEAHDSGSEGEENTEMKASRKRSRIASTSSLNSSTTSLATLITKSPSDRDAHPSNDVDSFASLTTSSLSPPTPPQTEVLTPHTYWNQTRAQPAQEDQESSRNTLMLLLAQSTEFKRQVVHALSDDIRHTNGHPSSYPASNTYPTWQPWHGDYTAHHNRPAMYPTAPAKHSETHEDILGRLLHSYSSSSAASAMDTSLDISAAMLSQIVPDRPLRGPLPSASVFLVLLTFLRGCVLVLGRVGMLVFMKGDVGGRTKMGMNDVVALPRFA